MTTIDLGEMPHPRPSMPSRLERFWAQVDIAAITTLLLGAGAAGLVLTLLWILR